jgi:hypothetical protein
MHLSQMMLPSGMCVPLLLLLNWFVFATIGEDGIIEAIQDCIDTTDKFYVEFGTQDCNECTTHYLRDIKNWTGLLLDGSNENPSINLHREMLYAENIVSLFQKYHVPHPTFDMLTVDIDLNTPYLLRAVLAGGYRPRMMVVEYNRNFAPGDSYVAVYTPDEMWIDTCYYGGSGLALERIAKAFGYSLVAFDRMGVNVYFVRNDILGMPFPHSFANLTRDTAVPAWHALHENCRHMLWIYVEDSPQLAGITWTNHLFPVLLSHRDVKLPLSPQQRHEVRIALNDWRGPKGMARENARIADLKRTSQMMTNSSQSHNATQAADAAFISMPQAPEKADVRTFYEVRMTSELAVLPCGGSPGAETSSTALAGVEGPKPQPEQRLTTLATGGTDDTGGAGLESHRRRRHVCRVQWLQHLKTADATC